MVALLSSSVRGGLICAVASAQFAMGKFFGGGGKGNFPVSDLLDGRGIDHPWRPGVDVRARDMCHSIMGR